MQIILIQSEIEQALKDFVSKRLTVTEDTDIQIELSATRGAEGIKAIIDLVPSTPKSTAASAGPKKATSGVKPAILGETPKNEAATPTAVTAKTSNAVVTVVSGPAPAPATAVEAAPETAQDEPEGTDAAETTQTAEAETTGETGEPVGEAAAAPATPPVRSLFANLRKPVNQS